MEKNYLVFLVNRSASTQQFWCFLQRPKELENESRVWANSSMSLAVAANSPARNSFVLTDRYAVEAGASNQPVQLSSSVVSSTRKDAKLTEVFEAKYADAPPRLAPTLTSTGSSSPAGTITLSANAFDQENNQAEGWFANMSFGLRLDQGFVGMSWAPEPSKRRTLTPRLDFYVTVGFYSSNTLASWNQISNSCAKLEIPGSFRARKATVTYTATGEWEVTPGEPPGLRRGLGPWPAGGSGIP